MSSDGHSGAQPKPKHSEPAGEDGDRARLPQSKLSIHRRECSDGASAKEAAPFKAHSFGGTGCGLVQHVFPLPARIQLRSLTARAIAPRRQAKNAIRYRKVIRLMTARLIGIRWFTWASSEATTDSVNRVNSVAAA